MENEYIDFDTIDQGGQRRTFTKHGSIKTDPNCPQEIIDCFKALQESIAKNVVRLESSKEDEGDHCD